LLPKIIAHRGDSAHCVENTLTSFRSAISAGADALEMDLIRCGSGEIVVSHDMELTRLAGRSNQIAYLTWDELAGIEIHAPGRPELTDRLCRLDDVFSDPTISEVISGPKGLWLCLELKDDDLERDVVALTKNVGAFEQTVFYSFRGERLAGIIAQDPAAKTNLLFGDRKWEELKAAAQIGCWSVNPEHRDADPAYIFAAHSEGLEVSVGNENDPAKMPQLFDLNVWGVHSDDPGALKDTRDRVS